MEDERMADQMMNFDMVNEVSDSENDGNFHCPKPNDAFTEETPEVVLELTYEDTESHIEEEQPYQVNETAEKGTQIHQPAVSLGHCSVEELSNIPGAISYYTFFQDLDHFTYVFNCLGPASENLRYKSQKLSPKNEFLLL